MTTSLPSSTSSSSKRPTARGPPSTWPAFSSLPLNASGPRGNAWGLFGAADELGMLNLLTPANTLSAAQQEIRSGERISLDWTLGHPRNPSFNRAPFKHTIRPNPRLPSVNDDELEFNTQCGSQWDGFRHYGYLAEQRWFNGHNRASFKPDSGPLGIDKWVEAGGIVGRGVLLDHARYVKTVLCEPPREVFAETDITLKELKAVAECQGVALKEGDVLFVRSGFTAAYEALGVEEEATICRRKEPAFIGVEPTREVLEWLWNWRVAAVAGDQPSFECAPIETHSDQKYMLHQWILAGWGVPIGEMFDLEELAAECERQGRWSFFVSSVPLKVPGGVASPPCAVAIF